MNNGKICSRLKNSRRNIFSGLVKQVLSIVLQFATRTAILYVLGVEYQGLSGLFTSILHVLNLTDLGFSAAVTFVLYKPIADDNQKEICGIVAYLKKVYTIIGFVILGVGIIILPFLPHLIEGTYPNEINIYLLYILYLLNTVLSYWFFAYKSTLLTALQRDDIASNVCSISLIASRMLQLIVVYVLQDYYIFVLCLLAGSLLNNLLLQYFSKKYFPQYVPKGSMGREAKQVLSKQVKAVFINRLSDIARNSFDNIILSTYCGLVTVAVYDNYFYVYSAVYGIMGIIARSLKASVGNSLVTEGVEKNYQDLLKFSFIFMWAVGWCTVCLCCLYQHFMNIWMNGNQELILKNSDMILFCIYFYVISATYTKGVYQEAKGLFWECRGWYIAESFANLILNLILGYMWGVTGILIATILTILVCNFVGGARALFRYYFKFSGKSFYLEQAWYLIVTTVACAITYVICDLISVDGIVGLIVKLAVCCIVPNVIYFAFYCGTQRFSEIKPIIRRFFAK